MIFIDAEKKISIDENNLIEPLEAFFSEGNIIEAKKKLQGISLKNHDRGMVEIAVALGKTEHLKLLINTRPTDNQLDQYLSLAVINNQKETVNYLLTHKLTAQSMQHVVKIAAKNGSLDMMQFLLNHKTMRMSHLVIDYNVILTEAVKSKNIDVVKHLLTYSDIRKNINSPQMMVPSAVLGETIKASNKTIRKAFSTYNNINTTTKSTQFESLVNQLHDEINRLKDPCHIDIGVTLLKTLRNTQLQLCNENTSPQGKTTALVNCFNAVKNAQQLFEKCHQRSVANVLANISLFILSLGVGYMVAGTIHHYQTGRFTFFNKPACAHQLPTFTQRLRDLNLAEDQSTPEPAFRQWSCSRI